MAESQLNEVPWIELSENLGDSVTHTVFRADSMVDVIKEWFKLKTPKERWHHFIDLWDSDKVAVVSKVDSYDFYEVQPMRGYNANGDIATRYQDATKFEIEFEDGDLVIAWRVCGGNSNGHRQYFADYKAVEEAEEAIKWLVKYKSTKDRYR